MGNQKNIIRDKSFRFALKIVSLNQELVKNKKYVIARQLLKSGTSIGANIEEATAAQTKKDFIAKMAIASKEARETKYWLRLLKHSKLIKTDFDSYLKEINDIVNILTAIVKTAQRNTKK